MRREESLPNFLVRHQQHRDRTRQAVVVPGAQSFKSMQDQGNAGLHIERARSRETSVCYAAGHRGERAHGIYRVDVSQEKDRLAFAAPREVHLQVVAEVRDAMKFCVAADLLEASGQKSAQLIHRRFVVAGGFDLDQLADGFSDGIFSLGEVKQSVGGFGGDRLGFDACGFFRTFFIV